MKRLFIVFLWLLFPVLLTAQDDFDSLIHVLDKTVDDCPKYSAIKEKRLEGIKARLKQTTDINLKYDIYGQLFNEYNSYKSDSALKYAQDQLIIAEKLHNIRKLNDARLNLSLILGIMGMYKESLEVIESIDKNSISDLKARYFRVYRIIYRYMSDYAIKQERKKYYDLTNAYRDSILNLVSNQPTSPTYVMETADVFKEAGNYDEALKLLVPYIPNLHSDYSRAGFAYIISILYGKKGNRELEKYWLAISAINDLKSINKEYIALRSLAFILYEEGDLERANKYIKRSSEDALFCDARLRTFEISSILPIIDKTYQTQIKKRQRQMAISLTYISFLTLFLIIAIILIYRQMRKLAVARKDLRLSNEQLFSSNIQLSNSNKSLVEANFIKEEYIGRYMDQCSIYIDKLDGYRRLLNKSAAAGKMDDLLRAIQSNDFIEEELKEFYRNFDSAFLQIFPNFVQDFRKLLADDEYVQLKQGQLLNTELRIYALMRLGITDNTKLSQFLRCSLSTIYNYRYKIKNKALVPRDEFEDQVMKIGS